MDLSALQNGSDIRGIALAVEGGKPVNLTEDVAFALGRAFVRYLRQKGFGQTPRVIVGRDSRISGEKLACAFIQGVESEGTIACDAGLATTPAMFMSTVTPGFMFDGAVMVTASHLPYERNGFKFFTQNGGLEKADIKEILNIAGEIIEPCHLLGSETVKVDFMSVYAEQLRGAIRRGTGSLNPLEGMRIIVDAGNGAGGFFATEVLQKLGADTSGSLYLEPDGTFPNHAPNPEDEKAMAHIINAVNETKADLGIIFDTDVDRAGAVLSDGKELNRNRLIAMTAAIILKEHPGTTIVTDSITSTGLAEFIGKKGGIHRRFKRGYRNVINEAIRLNGQGQDAQIAMETSGHGALKENYFLDDGAYLMVKLLIELAVAKSRGEELGGLIAELKEPKEAKEYRLAITEADFKPYGNKVIEAAAQWAQSTAGVSLAEDNFEGVRINFDKDHGDGWCLIRLSLHEPLLPVNIESDSCGPNGLDKIRAAVYPLLNSFDGIDAQKMA